MAAPWQRRWAGSRCRSVSTRVCVPGGGGPLAPPVPSRGRSANWETPFSSNASQQIAHPTWGLPLPHTRNGSLVGCLGQVEVVNLRKNAILVKLCSVHYQTTNHGEPLAQQMIVQSHPCGGLSSYMKREFSSTEFQDSGHPHGA